MRIGSDLLYLMTEINNAIGLVTKKFNEFFYVDILDKNSVRNKTRFLCTMRKSLSFNKYTIFVGDKVVINKINFSQNKAIIDKLIERKNCLERPSVANITDIYVTFSVDEPELSFPQVSKFLVNAETLNINVGLILTKCDLISEKSINLLKDRFRGWGYLPITLKNNYDNSLEYLVSELKTKKCSILIGPSGVGKTTLLNRIIPNLNNATGTISRKIKRGKNTTRNVELFSISSNSYIVDTPGFNLHNIELRPNKVQKLFPEIVNQISSLENRCKFRDCLHINEPGCILDKNFDRYQFYLDQVSISKNCSHQNQVN